MIFIEPKPTMSIRGGLDMSGVGRYQDDTPPLGRKVIFTENQNGHDWQQEDALNHFERGQVLTIKEIEVHRSHSYVEFLGYEGNRFNTVLFYDYEEDEKNE